MIIKNTNSTNGLLSKIDILRNEMIHIGEHKGLCHPETIRCSEKLDKLIY
ncbi:aspartyl-phosphate phosphatase Spo0E family protein [Neobacillus vireti]